MSIDAIYVYIDSYIIYIELGIVYIEILVFPDVFGPIPSQIAQ